MTCIAGLKVNGTVYIGGDSAGCQGWEITLRQDPKVFQRGPFLIGYTGSYRLGQLLRYSLGTPEHPDTISDHEYLAARFVDAVRDCLKAGGHAKKEHEQEDQDGGFLLGYRGNLYVVGSDFQVGEPMAPFAAVGCGAQIAHGALHVVMNSLLFHKTTPIGAISLALEAAEAYSNGVRGPFIVRELAA